MIIILNSNQYQSDDDRDKLPTQSSIDQQSSSRDYDSVPIHQNSIIDQNKLEFIYNQEPEQQMAISKCVLYLFIIFFAFGTIFLIVGLTLPNLKENNNLAVTFIILGSILILPLVYFLVWIWFEGWKGNQQQDQNLNQNNGLYDVFLYKYQQNNYENERQNKRSFQFIK